MLEPLYVNLVEVQKDVNLGIVECSRRGLIHCAKWLAELNHSLNLPHTKESFGISQQTSATGIDRNEVDRYYLAKSYFDCREYERSAYFTSECRSPVPKFLHYYAAYMSKEKRKLDNLTDHAYFTETGSVRDLNELLLILKHEHLEKKLDGYMLYLYGVVLKKLDLTKEAINVFVESVNAVPIMWSSWIELAPLISDKDALKELALPNHWMKHFFIAHTLKELYLNNDSIKHFENLQSAGFRNNLFITSELALIYHNRRDVDRAIEIFQLIQKEDPFRLENLDTFSNLLFVKDMKCELTYLAHKAVQIDKYRPETCCIIGNFYGIRGEHHKAVLSFQRALKLNPQYLAAWTLMGHEFVEMKNSNAAIQSYRKAVEVNPRDYRAWYGLGQSYEILKLSVYSLHYYKIAAELRPHDSRMLVGLGETYEKLDNPENALKCYQRACNVGDIEGIALHRLASLHEKLGHKEEAAKAYKDFCSEERVIPDNSALLRGYIFLANYHEARKEFDQAVIYCHKCLSSEETKARAQSLLRSIAVQRNEDQQKQLKPNDDNIDVDYDSVSMDESK